MRALKTRGGSEDAGTVTVELALALPSVVLVMGIVMAGGMWLRTEIIATSAAATAARVAMTDGVAAAQATAERVSGGDAGGAVRAVVALEDGGTWIVARVVVTGSGPMPDASATARVPAQP
jgi:Flp pilus assembly protein TadG